MIFFYKKLSEKSHKSFLDKIGRKWTEQCNFLNWNIQSDQPMRDEYLVACHLVDQSEEIYGHLSRGVCRGQDRLDERKSSTYLVC